MESTLNCYILRTPQAHCLIGIGFKAYALPIQQFMNSKLLRFHILVSCQLRT